MPRCREFPPTRIIRCLNASTYTADGQEVSRVHRGNIMLDIAAMTRASMQAINVLCDAWGKARGEAVNVPAGVSLQEAIPGFWRHLLTAKSSDLAGVLVGRSESHVEGLTSAFHQERREPHRLVKADFAQGWTKYIQSQPDTVRREGESAIADWIVNNGRIACELNV